MGGNDRAAILPPAIHPGGWPCQLGGSEAEGTNTEEHIPDANKRDWRILVDQLVGPSALVEAQSVHHWTWCRTGWGVIHRHCACAPGVRPHPFMVSGSAPDQRSSARASICAVAARCMPSGSA